MKNPYRKTNLRRLNRRNKGRQLVALVGMAPQYLLWQMSRLIPAWLGRSTRRVRSVVTRPFRKIIQFIQTWFITRPWKSLWLAAPVLIVAGVLATTLFLAKNQAGEDEYKEYQQVGYEAMQDQDFELASFLFGKLLDLPEYADDRQLAFQAMIAADQTGNQLRVHYLLAKLTDEMDYPPAHLWAASKEVSRRGGADGVQRAIPHLMAAVKAEHGHGKDRARIQLASLYMNLGQNGRAMSVLSEIANPDPHVKVMFLRCLAQSASPEEVRGRANDLLKELDLEDPTGEKFLMDRVETLSLLSVVAGTTSEQVSYLRTAAELFENRLLTTPDDREIKARLSVVYLGLAKLSFKSGDPESLQDMFFFLDQVMDTGAIPQSIGQFLLSISNLQAGGTVSAEDLRNGLVLGRGVVTCHLLLGFDAWSIGDSSSMRFHFRLAYSKNDKAMRSLEWLAVAMGSAGHSLDTSTSSFGLGQSSSWKRAISLLDVIPEIDPSKQTATLLAKCAILAGQYRWFDIPPLIEPQLDAVSDDQKQACYHWLVTAYQNLGDRKKVVKYKELLAELQKDEK